MKELTIQLQQEHKWGELNTFFKENSQYYKQIDNGEVFFIVGAEGTDFIANLFLNNLNETIVNDRIKSELIWNHIKYNRQGPEPWFDDHIIWDSPGHTDPKQHTTLLPESFEILKTLNMPETLNYNIDTNLKNFFSNDKTLNGTRYFITQQLPVIAYFYYKNFEKVKIILIDIPDVHIETYTRLLWTLRVSHGKGNSAILSPRPERTTLEVWAQEHGLYSVLDKFEEIKKIAGSNEYTDGIILEALITNQWVFIDNIERSLPVLPDTIEPVYVDILHNLSSKTTSGIMDFPIFADNLYKIDYENLFFFQNHSIIKTLMKLFKAKHSLEFYEKEIRKYNIANIKLKNQLEHELWPVLDKLKMNSLFCTIPISALFNIKPAIDVNFGASEVVGVLKEKKVNVIHLDLNARLNAYRREVDDYDELTDDEWNILTNVLCLKEFLNDHTRSIRLHRWATHLATFVGYQEIDFICFSLTHTVFRRRYFAVSGMLFGIILRKYLDFIPYTIPMYYGGKYMFRELAHLNTETISVDDSLSYPTTVAPTTNKFFDHLASNIPAEYLPLYYMADDSIEGKDGLQPSWGSEYQFAEHILNNLDTDKIRFVKQVNKEIKPQIDIKYLELPAGSTKKVKYIPDLQPLNFNDTNLITDRLFPEDFLVKFPECKSLKPFNYYNYRFSEGCIFKCAFCYHSTVDWLLTDNVNSIVDKLEYFYDNGIEYMRFFNDNINFKLSWTKEFCNEIVKRNIKLKWSDSANLKVGDRDMFLAMGEAGCVKLWYGTETYSSRILKEIDKWTDKMYERIDNTLVWAHEANIWNGANLICNFPHETDEEYEMLRTFIGDYYNSGIVNCMNVQPLAIWPPSTMYDHPEKFQIQLDSTGSMTWDGHTWGLKWTEVDSNGNIICGSEEICERGDYRVNHAFDYVNVPKQNIDTSVICLLMENDWLFYSLVQIYGNNKLKIKDAYHYILNRLATSEPGDIYDNIYRNWQEPSEYSKRSLKI